MEKMAPRKQENTCVTALPKRLILELLRQPSGECNEPNVADLARLNYIPGKVQIQVLEFLRQLGSQRREPTVGDLPTLEQVQYKRDYSRPDL